MDNSTKYTKEKYTCPVTSHMESVSVENITMTHKSSRSATPNKLEVVFKKVHDCSGIETCGVKITKGFGNESFNWDKCPLTEIFKKSR